MERDDTADLRASVIIPVKNMASLLELQLRALEHQVDADPFEVIVADNGSTDHLSDVIERWQRRMARLRVADASGRPGINHARNTGARAARSNHLLFCDADDEVERGWVAAMSAGLERADAAGGHLRVFDDRAGSWGTPFAPRRLVRDDLPRAPVGACSAVRRETWELMGGFDEELSGGAGDETEFFWRLQSQGAELIEVPGAVVRYRTSWEERTNRRKEYRAARERVRLLRWFGLQPSARSTIAAEVRSWTSLVAGLPVALARPREIGSYRRKVAKATGRLVGHVRYGRERPRFRSPATDGA